MERADTLDAMPRAQAVADRGSAGRWLLARLPAEVVNRLGEREIDAICAAAGDGWGRHPVDIRVSVPWLGRRFYITVISGPERRPKDRRAADGATRPLVTAGNVLFAIGLTTVLFLGGALSILFLTALVEY